MFYPPHWNLSMTRSFSSSHTSHSSNYQPHINSFLSLFLVLLSLGCGRSPEMLVAGSAHIEGLVADLSEGGVTVRNLIPGPLCPGHFDMRPGDIEVLSRGTPVLIHVWQEDMPNITALLGAVKLKPDQLKIIPVMGSWMTPSNQAAGARAISAALGEWWPSQRDDYVGRAETRAGAILAFGVQQQTRLAAQNPETIKVIANVMQADFVHWAGFSLIETYGRPEDLSVAEVERLLNAAKNKTVALVIDNLQSGDTKTSQTIAGELGARQVLLSNFPGGFPGIDTWEATLARNVDLLIEAIEALGQ
jgi:zinc transport system substrate-binding protein